MTDINISKIKIDNNELIIKDADGRQNIISLSSSLGNLSTGLNTLSDNLSSGLDTLSTNLSTLSGSLNTLSTNLDNNYLKLSGGTLTGNLTEKGNIWFQKEFDDGTTTVIKNLTAIMVSGNLSNSHFTFRQRNSSNTSYYDNFMLPDSATTNGTNSYNILTSKNGINDIIKTKTITAFSLGQTARDNVKSDTYFSTGTITVIEISKLIILSSYTARTNIAFGNSKTLGVLPSTYIPSFSTYSYIGNSSVLGQLLIRPDGRLVVYPVTGTFLTTMNLNFTVAFTIK